MKQREMRLKKREITDPEILREILESCEVVRIGAMDEEGMFIVPMNYGYDVREEDGTLHVCLYLHGAKEGRKAAAFAADPRVAVLIRPSFGFSASIGIIQFLPTRDIPLIFSFLHNICT